jgi:hypothetical protein
LDEESTLITEGNNGPLSGTRWRADRWHSYAGEDGLMNPDSKILINSDETTLIGEFWEDYLGTYPSSYYYGSTPELTISTAPHIYVFNSQTIDLRFTGNEIWIRLESEGTLKYYYFVEY